MSKVVLINQSTGYLMIDIVNSYARKYDSVALIAGSIDESDRKLDNSVNYSQIIAYNRRSAFSRLFSWCIAEIQIFILLLFRYRKYDVIYVTNPPFSYFLSLVFNYKYSIIVFDIYPDVLININIDPNNLIFKVWGSINRRVFNKATQVYTLSRGMANLLSRYCEMTKIKIIPNWSGANALKPIDKKNNPFVKKYHLENMFVIMYSGNIGYTHNVETILEIAKNLQDEKDICFFIIGEGGKKNSLMKIAKEEQLTSCHFLTWQPTDYIHYSLGAADLSIITLTDETAFVSVPSKTYNLLAVGSPLLCIAPQDSEIDVLVKAAECGRCFEKNKINEMVEYIKHLKKDEEYKKRLSANSVKVSLDYTYKNAELYVS
jgi:glycosyltransferase involved in cell wall biosynthesis